MITLRYAADAFAPLRHAFARFSMPLPLPMLPPPFIFFFQSRHAASLRGFLADIFDFHFSPLLSFRCQTLFSMISRCH